MAKLRLMTHNQWKCDKNQPTWEEQGYDCSAAVRAQGFVRVYGETTPDIIGWQENSTTMATEILRHTREAGLRYTLLWGRDTPIAYLPDKFELVDSDFSLFPDTCPGFEGKFNNGKTKAYALAVFRIKENGRLFIYVSTHLWHRSSDPESRIYQLGSDEARTYQLGIVMDRVSEFRQKYGDCTAFIVGDLNAPYDSPAVQSALIRGYSHAHDIAVDYADEAMGYHYCFPDGFKAEYYPDPFKAAIDHILVIGAPEGSVRRFERYSPDYYFPLSDHSPAFVDVEL